MIIDISDRMDCNNDKEQVKVTVSNHENYLINRFELVEIIDTRLNKELKKDYLIKFKSWIPEDHFQGLSNLLEQFWKEHIVVGAKELYLNDEADQDRSNSNSPRLYISENQGEETKSTTPQGEQPKTTTHQRYHEDISRESLSSLSNFDQHDDDDENADSGILNSSDEVTDSAFSKIEKEILDEDIKDMEVKNRMILELEINANQQVEKEIDVEREIDVEHFETSNNKSKSNETVKEDVLSPLNVQKPKKRKLKSLDDIVRKISNNTFQFQSQNDAPILCSTHKEDKENLIESCKGRNEHMQGESDEKKKKDLSLPDTEENPPIQLEGELRNNDRKKNIYWSGGKAFSKRQSNYENDVNKSPTDLIVCEFCKFDFDSTKEYELHVETCVKSVKLEKDSRNNSPSLKCVDTEDAPPPLMSFNECKDYSRDYNSENNYNGARMSTEPPRNTEINDKLNTESFVKLPIRNLLTKMYQTPNSKSVSEPKLMSEQNYHESVAEARLKYDSEPQFKTFRLWCHLCKRSLENHDMFNRHMRSMHPNIDTVPCEICNSIFIDKKELENHMLKYHSKKCYVCEECKEPFTDVSLYEQHKCRDAKDRLFKCHLCNQQFERQLNWSRHIEYAHPNAEKFHCRICGKIYFDRSAFKVHLRREHRMQLLENEARFSEKVKLLNKEGIYPYLHDSPSFPKPPTFKQPSPHGYHARHPTGPFPQEIENRSLRNESMNHKNHACVTPISYEGGKMRPQKAAFLRPPPPLVTSSYLQHPEQRFMVTGYPGNKPYSMPPYQHHNNVRNSNHNNSDVQKPTLMSILPQQQPQLNQIKSAKECVECDEKFTSQSLYEIHVQSHHKQTFHCDKCQRGFARKSLFDTHMKTHEPSKSHLCPYCQRSFSMKGNLRRHIRIHTNEAPYECPICFQRFRRSDGLKGHIRRHETMGETAPGDMLPSQAPNVNK